MYPTLPRLLFAASLWCGCALPPHAAAQATPLAAPQASTAPAQAQAQALAGWWEEYSPSSNIVYFGADGTVKLHLKKGEIGNLRTLDGTWTVADDGKSVRMIFTVNGQTLDRRAALAFPGKEMVLTDPDGTLTRHRRHSGKLPDKYVW